MEGMAEVGRRFNDNELIVAEVLQSAEAMKTAVGYLERFMEKADIEKRAKVILATVKGDVHDIGKNLVEIIFKNNGYDVINLGIKVPPEELIRAFKEHQPHAIGLSGLLVKSAQQMVITAADLREAGISVPLLVGGAALSEKFTRQKIAPSYGRHMGFKGSFEKALAEHDPRALQLRDDMEEVKRDAARFMKVRAIWQFFEAERAGNSIQLFAPGESASLHTFHFQRQRVRDGLCLSDYILPPAGGKRDHVVLFVVSAGEGIREKAEEAKAAGFYFRSHGLQALALESAEACAEWLHRRIREDWGFPDPSGLTMQDRFTARYRGKRYSFGYPACPSLDDQAGILKVLRADEIGVQLTEGMMMDPEASVSALVFHHPDCTYFSVGEPGWW